MSDSKVYVFYADEALDDALCAEGSCGGLTNCRKCCETRAAARGYEIGIPAKPSPPPASPPAFPQASDGSTASYYVLPEGAKELQDLISYRNMNAQLGEIFRACYRYGQCPHSPKSRDIKKIIFYAEAELARLEKYEASDD